jgi:hypothetical protein
MEKKLNLFCVDQNINSSIIFDNVDCVSNGHEVRIYYVHFYTFALFHSLYTVVHRTIVEHCHFIAT